MPAAAAPKKVEKKVAPTKAAPKTKKFGKGERTVARKTPGNYPVDRVAQPFKKSKSSSKVPLRASITPGTVLVLLAGKYQGKRVVFLKQLESGLLLVTGPFQLNGVPVRRVNQAYVIATSTKVDVSKVDSSAYADAFFETKAEKNTKSEDKFFANKKQAYEFVKPTADRVAAQKKVDDAVLSVVDKTPHLRSYLKSTFSLHSGRLAHTLKF
eukprot:TRINITY_DN3848_c1_g1_i1.p2 TRINITY_DN3848_c1_g1~~TRINITY_DN3848_c1_g1_i1.p2  ORF type:complete len:211 (-),score=59.88 TRINITY_DN3848_c1_g1_i1:95-727(-)